jgi:hypothetical protein
MSLCDCIFKDYVACYKLFLTILCSVRIVWGEPSGDAADVSSANDANDLAVNVEALAEEIEK